MIVNPRTMVVPYQYHTTMPYAYTWLNNTGAPGFYDWVMKGNGLYDPDVAVGGNSAYGLNELAVVWTSYKVLGSRVKVTVVNLDSSNPVNVIIVPTQTSNAFAAAQQDGLLHHPRARNMLVDRYDGSKSLTNAATTAMARNVKDVDDEGFQAAMNADPVHLWYWHVITWNNGGAASNCELKLEVFYDTVFSNPYPMTV